MGEQMRLKFCNDAADIFKLEFLRSNVATLFKLKGPLERCSLRTSNFARFARPHQNASTRWGECVALQLPSSVPLTDVVTHDAASYFTHVCIGTFMLRFFTLHLMLILWRSSRSSLFIFILKFGREGISLWLFSFFLASFSLKFAP